jgi:hypothetical protein
MIRALEGGDREALTRLVVQHIQPSKAAYLAVRRAMDGPAVTPEDRSTSPRA